MGFFDEARYELALILDISSGSVGGAFVVKNKDSMPMVFATHRVALPIEAHNYASRVETLMIQAVDQVCVNLQKKVSGRPVKVYCILGAPWAHGELRSISFSQKSYFRFTEKFAQKVVREEAKIIASERPDKQIIDKRITRVSLNGYATDFPHGQNARSLLMDVFWSFAEPGLVKKIEERVHKTFKSRVAFTSQMFSDFVVVRDMFEAQNDFLIINLGDEASEVALMVDDHMAGTAMLNFGQNEFIRVLASRLHKNLREAGSMLRLGAGGHLNPETKTKIDEVMEVVGSDLMTKLKKAILDLSSDRRIPSDIFISTREEFVPFLKKILQEKNFPEFTTLRGEFNAIIWDSMMVKRFCNFSADSDRDQALAKFAIFINKA